VNNERAGRTALFSAFARISPEGYQARRSLLAKRGLAYGKTVWS